MYYLLPWSLTAILYIPIFIQLYTVGWPTIDYNHAYFIIPISLWLVWRKRELIQPVLSTTMRLNILSLYLLALGLIIYLFGWQLGYLFISTFSMVPVILGLVLYFYGPQAAKGLLFPILYLLLLIPLPPGILDSIFLPIHYAIVFSADIFLKVFDVPVVRDGFHLSVNGNEINAGTAYSGLSSLAAMLALGLVYAHLIPLSLKNKTMLVLAIVPLALFGNFLLVLVTCLSVNFLGPKTAAGQVHFLGGLIIFIILTAFFMAVKKNLEENEYDY